MFQRVTIIGNLGQDPETRFLQSGSSVCSFSVATSRRWTNKDGNQTEETVWWRVSAWGKLGEICQQYLNKGKQVFIEGTMAPDRETNGPKIWIDQNGQARASYDLRADTMKMLGRRDSGGYGGGYNQQNYAQGGGGRSAPQQQQYPAQQQRPPAQQRSAAPQQRGAPAAPAQQYPPQQRQAPPRAPQQGRNRRSTASAPQQANDFGDDDFGPEEIPF